MTVAVMAYRNAGTVLRAVGSVLGQRSGEPFEVILVAPPRDPAIHAVRLRFPQVRIVECPRPTPGSARNAAVAAARGEIVAFLAADNLAEPGWVGGRLRAHRAGHPAVASAMTLHRPAAPIAWGYYYSLFAARTPGRAPGHVVAPHPAAHGLSFDRATLERAGPFLEDVLVGEDSDMAARLEGLGVRIWYEPSVRTVLIPPDTVRGVFREATWRARRRALVTGSLWPPIPPERSPWRTWPRVWWRVRYLGRAIAQHGRGHRIRAIAVAPWTLAVVVRDHVIWVREHRRLEVARGGQAEGQAGSAPRVGPGARRQPGGSRSIVFLHVPKTAGMTLRDIIIREYGDGAVFPVDGMAYDRSAKELVARPSEERGRIRAIVGHMPFGIDTVVPGDWAYVTMVRHPVERVVSHYAYARREPGSPLHAEIVARRLSLRDYVERIPAADLFNNGETRLLGSDFSLPPGKASAATAETLERAMERARERFALVGVVERFDESVLLMARMFGWRWPLYVRRYVAPERPRRSDLPESTVRAIEERNQLDLRLYRFARELFDQTMARQDAAFRVELAAFRLANAALARWIKRGARRAVGVRV